jgi:alkanesulfonate monooxygenase SsuD/methylene tetrahydromethanopterin reductase-like flavin-dependent oxidoreductase (luciferase family)
MRGRRASGREENAVETTAASVHPWVAAGAHRLRFAINMTASPDWGAVRDFVQTAEALGFDAIMMPDHPAVLPSGTWTMLATLAEQTCTIRLGTLVSCLPYWNPVVLARRAADMDRLSGERRVAGRAAGEGQMPGAEGLRHVAGVSYAFAPTSTRPRWRMALSPGSCITGRDGGIR